MDNVLLLNELDYLRHKMLLEHEKYFPQLTDEQMIIYGRVINYVNSGRGGFDFVHGYGGTSKTFVWKALSAKFCHEGKVVLNVASSGITLLLLPDGRTIHSTLAIPLQLTEDSICNIKLNSPNANLLRHCSVIIWDEAPMTNKWVFEALNRTLKDLMRIVDNRSFNRPFGGEVTVLGGDFRQILPVIPKAGRAKIVTSSVNSSFLWCDCEVLTLTKNMCLRSSSSDADAESLKTFGKWILNIGEGKIGNKFDCDFEVDILDDLLIIDWDDLVLAIISCIYPQLLENIGNYKFFEVQAILAPTVEVVELLNDIIIQMIHVK